jgi:hypothetical protein
MIQYTVRQFRTQAAAAFGALTIIAIVLAMTGRDLAHLYDTSGISTCKAQDDCGIVTGAFLAHYQLLQQLNLVVILAPCIIGIFWGAPLVARELETGTFRLAWTQSVTRIRWLAVKLGLVGMAGMAVAGLFSLMVTWWFSPIDRVNMNAFGVFDQRDIVPIGYAAFAFALGVTAGILTRQVLPAMTTTLVAFVAARLVMVTWIRPHLITPIHRDFALDPVSTGFGSSGLLLFDSGPSTLQPTPPDIPNAWITSTEIVDRAGHALTSRVLMNDCPGLNKGGSGAPGGRTHSPASAAAQQGLHDCVVKVGATYHEVVAYQPANRYWAFQWYELTIFLAAALVLAGFCFWWIRHRLS